MRSGVAAAATGLPPSVRGGLFPPRRDRLAGLGYDLHRRAPAARAHAAEGPPQTIAPLAPGCPAMRQGSGAAQARRSWRRSRRPGPIPKRVAPPGRPPTVAPPCEVRWVQLFRHQAKGASPAPAGPLSSRVLAAPPLPPPMSTRSSAPEYCPGAAGLVEPSGPEPLAAMPPPGRRQRCHVEQLSPSQPVRSVVGFGPMMRVDRPVPQPPFEQWVADRQLQIRQHWSPGALV